MIKDFGGLSKQMPIYAALFMIITLSSIGLPSLNGFIGEFAILIGAFKALWMTTVVFNKAISTLMMLLATSGIVLGAAYMLWMYQRVMFGKLENPENMKLKDLNLREIATLVPIVVFCFWIGLYPKPFLEFMDGAVMNTVLMANPKAAIAEMEQMEALAAQEEGASSHGEHPAVLPPGHPPIMPEGHPPVGHGSAGDLSAHEDTAHQSSHAGPGAHADIPEGSHGTSGHADHGGDE